VHGEVERENIVKGYEYADEKFVTIDEADLEKVRLETTATLDLVQWPGSRNRASDSFVVRVLPPSNEPNIDLNQHPPGGGQVARQNPPSM
jgi:hypothetical protein